MGTFNAGGLNAPPTSIVNGFSAGGATASALAVEYGNDRATKVVLSGALTADTYKEMLAVTDSGILFIAAVQALDITSRTMGIKVVVDGTTVFDASCAANTTDNAATIAVGYNEGGYLVGLPVVFNTSLSLQIKSSLSETDKIQIIYLYHTT